MKIIPSLILACLTGLGCHAPLYAQSSFSDNPEVTQFISDMGQKYAYDGAALEAMFASVEPNDTVLTAILPGVSAESRSWQRYRAQFLTDRRIREGVAFWNQHPATLAKAEAEFGVPAEIIVAIIGVETEYGRHMGRFNVFRSLATLAFNYPPRAEFFRGELEQFLLLTRENGIPPMSVKGSFAGAIGIPQFMPGSQRRYGVDFDGDGHIDLWHSPDDAIGSVARFLHEHGWQPGAPIAEPLPGGQYFPPDLTTGSQPRYQGAELAQRGLPIPPAQYNEPLALIALDTPEIPDEDWIGHANFYAITRYNHSSFYAMSVFQLGEAVRAAREQPGEGVIGNAAPAAPSPSGRTSRHRPALGESQKKASHRHPAGNKAKKKH